MTVLQYCCTSRRLGHQAGRPPPSAVPGTPRGGTKHTGQTTRIKLSPSREAHQTVPTPAHPGRLAPQALSRPPEPLRCGTVWDSLCPRLVGPPQYRCEQHLAPEPRQIRYAARTCNVPELLQQLAAEKDINIRRLVAGNRHTLPGTLGTLSRSGSPTLRLAVASNPGCPPEVLVRYSRSSTSSMRQAVASHPRCPLPVLQKLLRDPVLGVRQAVVANPSLPRPVLAMWELTGLK